MRVETPLIEPHERRSEAESLRRRVAELEIVVQAVTAERDKLRKDYELLRMEVALLQRRIFAARAERIDTKQLEMEFAAKRAQLLSLTNDVEEPAGENASKTKKKPHGRRDLSLSSLPQERCEIRDPEFELAGCECIGFEESTRLGYKRGGAICIIVARAKYKIAEKDGSLATAALPKEIVARSLCAPSMMAKVLVDKFADGLPFFRQEERLRREGISLDRSVMSRVAEEVGMTLGCIVLAARDHAMKHAFCLATDATGVAIQPTRIEDGPRQACRKGPFRFAPPPTRRGYAPTFRVRKAARSLFRHACRSRACVLLV